MYNNGYTDDFLKGNLVINIFKNNYIMTNFTFDNYYFIQLQNGNIKWTIFHMYLTTVNQIGNTNG